MRTEFDGRVSFARAVLACVVGTLVTTTAAAQLPANQRNSDRVVVSTDEVPLDVVVRDKKGRLINDLTASDFEVYEDGVRQELNSFRFVAHSRAATSMTSGAGSTDRDNKQSSTSEAGTTKSTLDRAGANDVRAVALVFDRLSPDARARATQAALAYLQESANSGELFGVFLTDLSVVVLQPFTDDRQLVKSGIEKAGLRSPSLYISNNEKAREKRDQITKGLNEQQSGQVSARGLDGLLHILEVELRKLEREEVVQRDQQGEATTRGLLLIASALGQLPGRKAVIFFSEGLTLPTSVMRTFSAIINAANRNNVSFYTVDAAGLRVESKTAETNREVSSRSDLRMAQLGTDKDPMGPMTKGLERNEDLLRLNPDSGLGQLANETGGFLITDSNDLKRKLRQVDEDLHAYYLMSYRSNNQNYDGHFRTIEVKVKRSGLAVQSRKGYYAIKGTFSSPVLAYEVPVLAALENAPKANSFPFYAGGFSFPDKERMGLTSIIADVQLSVFTFDVDPEKKFYTTDFSVMALVKDQAGQVVEKLSRQYRLTGPGATMEGTKQSRILFYREVDLEFGRYMLEVIAYDALGRHASVHTGIIEVTASDENKLRLSDVVILNRAQPADQKRSSPFRVGNVIVSPNLGEPIHRSLKQLPFFVTVYAPSGTTRPKITVELLKEGHTLAEMPGELPESDPTGRIQYLAALPLDKIPAGVYELKVTVIDRTASLSRSACFTIED